MVKANLKRDDFPFASWYLADMDMFGQNLTFNIRKRKMFGTKLGGIISILFVMLIFCCILYFLFKVYNTVDPTINLYHRHEPFKANLNSYDIYHYFLARNIQTKSNIDPISFWGSFHIETSIVKTNYDEISYQKIEMVSCGSLEWTNDISDLTQKNLVRSFGICYKKSDITNDIISTDINVNTKLVVNLYTCQSDCNNSIDKKNLEFSVNVYEENYNIVNYMQPKHKVFKNIRLLYPSSLISTHDVLSLRKTVLDTDRGSIVSWYELQNILEQDDLKTSIREVTTDQNYFKNFVQHNSSFDSDT